MRGENELYRINIFSWNGIEQNCLTEIRCLWSLGILLEKSIRLEFYLGDSLVVQL